MYAGILLNVTGKCNCQVLVHLSNDLYILYPYQPKFHSACSMDESYHIKHMECTDVGDDTLSVS